MKLCRLEPGDRIVDPNGTEAILIEQCPHPLYPGFNLVIWWIVKDPFGGKRYSLDALVPDQELAPAELLMPSHPLGVIDWYSARRRNLREALAGQRA